MSLQELVIHHGQVMCPRRGQAVDLEQCLVCPYFQGVRALKGRPPVLECNRTGPVLGLWL
ncbi:MAG: hypothetical protein K6U14_06880 [Firmicutes bacterium]|nr:hypothetical protein [Alicyclobacillaceae bacterium]MCL6497343.1 hypothetical protein [Bacillota bacterium]